MSESCQRRPGLARTQQCEACPWKLSAVPSRDIPGGYAKVLHEKLLKCDGDFGSNLMACHESPLGAVGPGNSIPLRLAAMSGQFNPTKLVLEGEQHDSLQAMVLSANKKAPRRGAK